MQSPEREPTYSFKKGVGWVQEPVQITFDHTDLSVWTTGDGRVLRVVDMTNQHIINAIRKLERDPSNNLDNHNLASDIFECPACEKQTKLRTRIISLQNELNRRRENGIFI